MYSAVAPIRSWADKGIVDIHSNVHKYSFTIFKPIFVMNIFYFNFFFIIQKKQMSICGFEFKMLGFFFCFQT